MRLIKNGGQKAQMGAKHEKNRVKPAKNREKFEWAEIGEENEDVRKIGKEIGG